MELLKYSIDNVEGIKIIIICRDCLHEGARGGRHVKTDNALTIVEHGPLSPYTWQLRLDIRTSALLTVYPYRII